MQQYGETTPRTDLLMFPARPGNMTGVLSERDYICKIALLGRTSKETKCKEICTVAGKIITAKSDESVELCMEKMMNHGIRHLPIVDESKKIVGMVSIKDLVKTVVQEKEQAIKVLSDFALGKGGHFGSE
jgi:CBS-domain-containing membrane protein